MPPAVASVESGLSVNKGSRPKTAKSSSSTVSFAAFERKALMGLTTCDGQRVPSCRGAFAPSTRLVAISR
jgi:hypothetical protein